LYHVKGLAGTTKQANPFRHLVKAYNYSHTRTYNTLNYVSSINVSQGKLIPIPKNVKEVAEYP
jgi:hypothetical protein